MDTIKLHIEFFSKILAINILLFISCNTSFSEVITTDYGSYQIKTTKIEQRDFLSLSSIGKIVFGTGTKAERFSAENSSGSLSFLPGSFFFRYQEQGIDRTLQMMYPAVRDLGNSENLLIPFHEFCIALSGNMFDFRKVDNGYVLNRTEEFKTRLYNAAQSIAPINTTVSQKQKVDKNQSLQSSRNLYIQGNSDRYAYSRLRRLPQDNAKAEQMVDPLYGLTIPKTIAGSDRNKGSYDKIPVFEDGKMDYGSQQPKPKIIRAKNNLPKMVRMGKTENDTILPPSINYEVPENIYRRELENKKSEKKNGD